MGKPNETDKRIQEILHRHSSMVPIYNPTRIVSVENKLVSMTYSRLQEIAGPYIGTLQMLNDFLGRNPDRVLHTRGVFKKHRTTALSSPDPELNWFIDFQYRTGDPKLAGHWPEVVERASFVLAKARNIIDVQKDGFEIGSSAYNKPKSAHLVSYVHPTNVSQTLLMTDVEKAIGVELTYPDHQSHYESAQVRTMVVRKSLYSTAYPFLQTWDGPDHYTIEKQFGYNATPPKTIKYEYYDGYFRKPKSPLTSADPTIEEEIAGIFSQLPFEPKDISEKAEWEAEFNARYPNN